MGAVALIAVLAGCGGSAVASAPEISEPIDVRAVAQDEIAALAALGYPMGLIEMNYLDEYTNSAGGTATTWQVEDGTSRVDISLDGAAYEQFGPDVEASIRSTVRHEYGHALTYWLFPSGAETSLSAICHDTTPASIATDDPAGECAAEAISDLLASERGDERVPFYGISISDESRSVLAPILRGAPTWSIPVD